MKSSAQQQIHVAWMSQSHGKAIDFSSHSEEMEFT